MFPDFCIIYHESKDNKAFVCRHNRLGESWWKHYFPGAKQENVVLRTIDGVAEGVFYSEMLAGADGMSFTLFRETGHTDEDIRKVKTYLRNTRDVTGFHVVKVNFD